MLSIALEVVCITLMGVFSPVGVLAWYVVAELRSND